VSDARKIHDPFLGKDVVIIDRLVDRLRGNYACGPHLPNGRPEFGFRQFQAPPIQHEAAAVIEALVKALQRISADTSDLFAAEWADEALELVGSPREQT